MDALAPAVGLVDPKFPHNVGAAVRAASCYGIRQVWFSGDRVRLDASKGYRLPREERMRGYKDVVRVRAGLEVPYATASTGGFDEPDHMADAVGVTWGAASCR
jgi:hypothetical protein